MFIEWLKNMRIFGGNPSPNSENILVFGSSLTMENPQKYSLEPPKD